MGESRYRRFGKWILWVAAAIIVATAIYVIKLMSAEGTLKGDIQEYARAYAVKLAEKDSAYIVFSKEIGSSENDSILHDNLKRFSRRMFENGNQLEAFQYLKRCVGILNSTRKLSPEAANYKVYCYLLLGASADEVGLRAVSHDFYFEGLKNIDRYGVEQARSEFYNNIGVSLFKTGNKEEAEKHFRMAITEGEASGNSKILHIVYTNLSEMASLNNDNDEAISLSLKALNYIDPQVDVDDYLSILGIIGDLYRRKRDYAMAQTYMRSAYDGQVSRSNKSFLFETCLGFASVFEDMGSADSASAYLYKAELLALESRNPDRLVRVYSRRSDMAAQSGDTEKAYDIERKIVSLKDSLYMEECATRISEANALYDSERDTMQNSSGISRWNPVILFVCMGILVLGLIASLIWLAVMKKNNDRLNAENAKAISDYAGTQSRLLDAEKDKNRQISEDLQMHHQKLTSFTLSHLKTNQQIESVETDVKRLLLQVSQREKGVRETLKDILIRLVSIKADTSWDEFHYYFEKVHPDFYRNLDIRHKQLTPKDRRLCALISLGLSTKEIAEITFREVRSVESSRNRLRKKLGLESDSSLFEYLLGMNYSSGTASAEGIAESSAEEQSETCQ